MKLHELSPVPGSTHKGFRKGRGAGSGNGKTAGKGHKGQNARSGGGVRPDVYKRQPRWGGRWFVSGSRKETFLPSRGQVRLF